MKDAKLVLNKKTILEMLGWSFKFTPLWGFRSVLKITNSRENIVWNWLRYSSWNLTIVTEDAVLYEEYHNRNDRMVLQIYSLLWISQWSENNDLRRKHRMKFTDGIVLGIRIFSQKAQCYQKNLLKITWLSTYQRNMQKMICSSDRKNFLTDIIWYSYRCFPVCVFCSGLKIGSSIGIRL